MRSCDRGSKCKRLYKIECRLFYAGNSLLNFTERLWPGVVHLRRSYDSDRFQINPCPIVVTVTLVSCYGFIAYVAFSLRSYLHKCHCCFHHLTLCLCRMHSVFFVEVCQENIAIVIKIKKKLH